LGFALTYFLASYNYSVILSNCMKLKHLNHRNFKVIELDWYCNFRNTWHRLPNNRDWTDEEILEYELTRPADDGPLRYLEVCEDQPFPIKDNIKYCVRLTQDEKFKVTLRKGEEDDWYWCYCYQLGKWWKYKGPQYLFYDLFIPIFDMDTFYRIYDSKTLKYLNHNAIKSYRFWREIIQINGGVRRRLDVYKIHKRLKSYKQTASTEFSCIL